MDFLSTSIVVRVRSRAEFFIGHFDQQDLAPYIAFISWIGGEGVDIFCDQPLSAENLKVMIQRIEYVATLQARLQQAMMDSDFSHLPPPEWRSIPCFPFVHQTAPFTAHWGFQMIPAAAPILVSGSNMIDVHPLGYIVNPQPVRDTAYMDRLLPGTDAMHVRSICQRPLENPKEALFVGEMIQKYFAGHRGTLDVIDVSCGKGDVLLDFNGLFSGALGEGLEVSLHGVDVDRRAIAQLSAWSDLRWPIRGSCVGLLSDHFHTQIEQDFDRRLFDVVVFNAAIEHMPDPEGALARVVGLLKPGGLLVMRGIPVLGSVRAAFGPAWGDLQKYSHCFLFHSRSLVDFFDRLGLSVTTESIPYLTLDESGYLWEELWPYRQDGRWYFFERPLPKDCPLENVVELGAGNIFAPDSGGTKWVNRSFTLFKHYPNRCADIRALNIEFLRKGLADPAGIMEHLEWLKDGLFSLLILDQDIFIASKIDADSIDMGALLAQYERKVAPIVALRISASKTK